MKESNDTRRPKGTGSIRKREGRFQAMHSFLDAMGHRRRHSKLFRTKTEARSWLNDRLAEIQSGHVAEARDLTLGHYLSEWLVSLSRGGLEPTTLTWYRSAVTRHIIPALGSMRLVNMSPQTIETFLAEKAMKGRLDGSGGPGPASVRRLQVTLHKAFDAAVRKGFLTRNPSDLAESPKVPRIDATAAVWTPQALAEFVVGTSDDRFGGIWRMAAMTGIRRSELCGLTWPDVELESGIISVRRAAVVVDGRRYVKSPKTPSSRRAVELDRGTVQSLRERRTDSSKNGCEQGKLGTMAIG